MKAETVTLVVALAIIGAAVFFYVQQQREAAARAAALRDPGQQLASGIGNIVGGIVGLATGGGGSS